MKSLRARAWRGLSRPPKLQPRGPHSQTSTLVLFSLSFIQCVSLAPSFPPHSLCSLRFLSQTLTATCCLFLPPCLLPFQGKACFFPEAATGGRGGTGLCGAEGPAGAGGALRGASPRAQGSCAGQRGPAVSASKTTRIEDSLGWGGESGCLLKTRP